MIHLFFLNSQHKKIYKMIDKMDINKQGMVLTGIFDARMQLAFADRDIKLFNIKSKGFVGTIKSFVPGTKAFSCRVTCAKSLNTSRNLIKSISRLGGDNRGRHNRVSKESITRTINEAQETLPTCYPSPVGFNHFKKVRITNRSRSPSPEQILQFRSKRMVA